MDEVSALDYRIFDPTGNITALVESPVPAERQPTVAAALMRRHPEVEQVGFVRFAEAPGAETAGELRMAGGEFCGNASMCAAALYLLRREEAGLPVPLGGTAALRLRVSGARRPVELRLRRETAESFRAEVRIPPARAIRTQAFSFEDRSGVLPLVEMEGISHAVAEPGSAFFALREDRDAAGRAVRAFCDTLGAEGLGLLFLEGSGPELFLTPLVYIPGSGTLFWENSCASGSAAVGMLLAARRGARVELRLREPAGVLRVRCEAEGETWLGGSARQLACFRAAL